MVYVEAPLINLEREARVEGCFSHGISKLIMLPLQTWSVGRLVRAAILILSLVVGAGGDRNTHNADFQRLLAPGGSLDPDIGNAPSKLSRIPR